MSCYKYLIQTEEDLESLIDYIKSEPFFAYDTETNAKFTRSEVSLVGISFGFSTFACYIPVNHLNSPDQLSINLVLDRLKPVFEDPNTRCIAHNAKFDEMVLKVHGIDVKGPGDDTYVMAWLLSEDRRSKSLKSLTEQYLGIKMETYDEVISKRPKKRGVDRDFSFARVSLADALSYAADDAYYTYRLFEEFTHKLRVQKLLQAYEHIERPFIRVLRKLEDRGVYINREYMAYASKRLPEIAEQIEAEIYREADEVFNIRSGKQLGEILFEKLSIGNNVPKTKKGDYSTSKKTLETYQSYNIVNNVLRLKKINKTYGTFVEGLQPFIEKDGRIHASFNGCGTVTGRLSSYSPNLQQITVEELEEVKIRNFFTASPGNTLVVSDYSQVEYRVMAHFSKDENMIKAFFSGHDFHEETAKGMLKIDKVTRKDRTIAKTINFGVGYGRGPNSVAEQLGISFKEAQRFITDYFENYTGLAQYKEWLIQQARRNGFIRTISGRKRRLLPEIRSNDWSIRGSAERQAFNTKIQGSAADIIKAAMISLAPKIAPFNAGIIIQIHDELVVECPAEHGYTVASIMKDVMEHPLNGKNPLRVPLVTEPSIVQSWGDAKE